MTFTTANPKRAFVHSHGLTLVEVLIAATISGFVLAGVLAANLSILRIPARPDGTAGLTFARFDRDGAAVTTDAATKSIQVNMTAGRSAPGAGPGSSTMVSATFTLRSKPCHDPKRSGI